MRQTRLDVIRGAALVSMILYHACWDLAWMFGLAMPWYQGFWAHVWQQSICWTFILLSGYCWPLGRRQRKHGLITFGCGFLLTLVTAVFLPENLIFCGVLTLLGSSSLLLLPLRPALEKIPARLGLAGSFLLFLLLRDVNSGFLGFEGVHVAALPSQLYQNHLTAYLGFPPAGFFSTDYFPLLPWFFLFLTGYFLCRLPRAGQTNERRLPLLAAMGRRSLLIYMLHQPVIYGFLLALHVLFQPRT